MKTLNVKPVTSMQVTEKWKIPMPFVGVRYIRCNAKGEVNWDKAPLFTAEELIERNDVKIIK